MLNKPFEGITRAEDGSVTGVTSEGETAKCKIVVADLTIFPEKCKKGWSGRQSHLFATYTDRTPATASFADHHPAKSQVGRKSDYVCVSFATQCLRQRLVCGSGQYHRWNWQPWSWTGTWHETLVLFPRSLSVSWSMFLPMTGRRIIFMFR